MRGEQLTIGLLHLGSAGSGIHQDGQKLAAALSERPGLRIIEYTIDVTGGGVSSLRGLLRASRVLAAADITIVPYSPHRTWAAGHTHLIQLVLSLLVLPRPVTVLHDIYPSPRWRSRNWWALTACGLLSRAVVFHEEHERATLATIPLRPCLIKVPLAVESMSLPARSRARDELGVSDSAVVLGMVGWIHARKNCERAVEVLASLPEGAQLWLMGSPTPDAEAYRRRLEQLAADLGVADRLSITGYLDDDELRSRVSAIDVALAPYSAISASASLSTILGARRPVLASDLPVTRELRDMAPNAIRLTDDPAEMTRLVQAMVANPPGEGAFAAILRARSPQAVAERFEHICRSATRRRGRGFATSRTPRQNPPPTATAQAERPGVPDG